MCCGVRGVVLPRAMKKLPFNEVRKEYITLALKELRKL